MLTAGLAILAALSLAGCSRETAGDARRFQLTGVVVGREASPPRVVVAHDAVEGLMPAMSMAFDIRGSAAPVRDGDRIAATLVVTDSQSWLEDVTVRARDGAAAIRLPAASRAMPGAVVPDLPLVDQDGAPVTLGDGAGRVRIVTFIYTRCPLPDFCPLMIKHLEAVRRRANQEGLGSRLALLGVTLDPSFDTPPVLRAYGESVLKGGFKTEMVRLPPPPPTRQRGYGGPREPDAPPRQRTASTSGRLRREPPRKSKRSPGSSVSDTAPKADSSPTR